MTSFLNIPIAIISLMAITIAACGDDDGGGDPTPAEIQLVTARAGSQSLLVSDPVVSPVEDILLGFSEAIDPSTNSAIRVLDDGGMPVDISYENTAGNRIVTLSYENPLEEGTMHTLDISSDLKGAEGEPFTARQIAFGVMVRDLEVTSLSVQDIDLDESDRNMDIPLEPVFEVTFTHALDVSDLEGNITLVGDDLVDLEFADASGMSFTITPSEKLADLRRYELRFKDDLGDAVGRNFEEVEYEFFTVLDTTPDFPIISDEELLTLVQEQTFKYFWDYGHPACGMARERYPGGELVTSGGSGFGLMAMVVAVERGFITRDEALDRWATIFNFLEGADRFHGAWSHWINGSTGEVIPFSERDDGGDLVETAFLVQGMITVRQYLDENIQREKDLIDLIDTLWHGVEWDWYRRGEQNVLFWHWSPENEWAINLPIRGHNETQIIYTLAAASPTHSIPKEVYDAGYARSGGMQNGKTFYGYELPLGIQDMGGPLFFTHYSYLGMDPRNLQDAYANYWEQNINHTLINRAYCIDNPLNYAGYSESCWGLTASDGNDGYSAHSPINDRGVLTPTAAISSIPYTPEESLEAIRHFYYILGDRLWGEYGFYDAFNPTADWVAGSFLAIDQGPIICMIENYRTGLLWDLYMSAPEVKAGLDKLGFTY